MAQTLAPVNPPLAIFGQHVRDEVTTLVVVDQMLRSGDDYIVRTAEGNNVIYAKAKEWDTLDRKVVYGEDKQVLCEIKDKAFTLHHTVEAVGGGGIILKAEQAGNNAFRVHVLDKVQLEVSGDWAARSARITYDGNVIARVRHDVVSVSAAEDLISPRHAGGEIESTRYRLEVAPGVDLALMAVMCICIDVSYKGSHR